MKRPAVIANEAGADNIGGLFPLDEAISLWSPLLMKSEIMMYPLYFLGLNVIYVI